MAMGLSIKRPSRPLSSALMKPKDAQVEAYIHTVVVELGSLSPSRSFATAGLERDEADQILDLVASAAGPQGRVGWLGISSELSPAAVHLGLLQRGGSRERFRADAGLLRADGQPDMCMSFLGVDPGWSRQTLLEWAGAFDVIITTRPGDLKGRANRAFVGPYQQLLEGEAGWEVQRLGTVEVTTARGELSVEVLACRRP